MKKKNSEQGKIAIYKDGKRQINLKVYVDAEAIWLDAHQMAELFDVDRTGIVRHIQNIYKDDELKRNSTCAKIAQVAKDGKTRKMDSYNLDMIISVGYRVNSKKATQFRIWATSVLKKHLTQGYTINKTQVIENYKKFMKAVEQVKKLLPASNVVDTNSALELAQLFASTWFSLDAYDKSSLPVKGLIKKEVDFTVDELSKALVELKKELIIKKEATKLFGSERGDQSLAGIVGNVFQSFGGEDLYVTIEEKAAHLFYFIIKNHPFADGNKRSGAFAFVWFLSRSNILEKDRLTPIALTALTLFVAESDPKDKDRIVGLILLLLSK